MKSSRVKVLPQRLKWAVKLLYLDQKLMVCEY